jgi:hypothetical protein
MNRVSAKNKRRQSGAILIGVFFRKDAIHRVSTLEIKIRTKKRNHPKKCCLIGLSPAYIILYFAKNIFSPILAQKKSNRLR